ncbi:MAG: AAA family ATPase [Alphaproteobacteria bacterium]|nr:AAA family ATPase [Alphaproteobacteria bacterium]
MGNQDLAPSIELCDSRHRMITSFELTGFRCFEHFSLEGLAQVNVVTGANASGKSALLEALLIAARGSPETLILLDNIRGIPVAGPAVLPFLSGLIGTPMAPPGAFTGVWDHYFRTVTTKRNGKSELTSAPRITMVYTDSDGEQRGLSIFFEEQSAGGPVNVITQPYIGITQNVPPLVLERTSPGVPVARQTVVQGPQGQLQVQPRLPDFGPAVFIFPAGAAYSAAYSETDNLTWFSLLREAGNQRWYWIPSSKISHI